jgi:ribosomal protein S18 acetylase RimI-like enzyme
MVLHLRAARREELAAVGELTVAAYLAGGALKHGAHDPYTTTLRDTPDRFRHAELLVVVDAADPPTLLATVTACPAGSRWAEIAHDDELELRMLAVDPDHRGQGIATWTVEALRAEARHRGRTIVVSVIDSNRPAHRLYERLGFVRVPERDWEPAPGICLQVRRDAAG